MPGIDRWQATWGRLQVPVPPATAYQELIARYSEPHRSYHTVRHLDECFEKLGEIEDEAARLGEIEVALWFHDAIYDVRAKDNEAKSADWARAVAVSAGIEPAAAGRIHSLVLCTVHDAVPSGDDERILVDVDLSILGAPAERFDEYERQIRAEYSWVPEGAFRGKRREILAQFLARPRIYSTRTFIDRYERRARENLDRSIARLDEK
jgi:predicted metal-dependent HD superfamily phosphohydrolase